MARIPASRRSPSKLTKNVHTILHREVQRVGEFPHARVRTLIKVGGQICRRSEYKISRGVSILTERHYKNSIECALLYTLYLHVLYHYR